MNKIITRRDAENARIEAEARAQFRIELREARRRVKHWQQQVARYGGEVHRETLARMRAALAALEGRDDDGEEGYPGEELEREEPEDTPTLENCDDAGTGEGRWHGRM